MCNKCFFGIVCLYFSANNILTLFCEGISQLSLSEMFVTFIILK